MRRSESRRGRCTGCSREFGETPGAWYRNLRLDRAASLLCYSRLGIGETATATATSFSGAAGFSHAFTRRFGRAPSRARGHHSGQYVDEASAPLAIER